MTREQLAMLKEIMALEFTVLELNLFLNTHPRNREALEDHNRFARDLRNLKMEYQKMYGPFQSTCPSQYPWQYISMPWPWQIEY